MSERVTFFGDISGIRPANLHAFVEATRHHKFGGSFPNRERTIPDSEITRRTQDVLRQTGIPNPSPIVLCNSVQERAERILAVCQQHNTEKGPVLYWIIDQDPDSLTDAMRFNQEAILKSITAINLGSIRGYDYRDPTTGIRICSIPYPLMPFPAHPTPAS